jgi:hypothetical protein
MIRLTNVTGQNEEIVVSQGSVLVGVQESVHIQTITSGIGLHHLEGSGVVLDLSLHGGTGGSLLDGDRHDYFKKRKYIWNQRLRWDQELRGIKSTDKKPSVDGESPAFPKKRKKKKKSSSEEASFSFFRARPRPEGAFPIAV